MTDRPAQSGSGGAGDTGVRAAAAAVLERCLAGRLPLDGLLRQAAARFDDRDRALLRSLVLGTTRWLRRIDAVLAAAAARSLAEIDPPLLAPLRIGIYQLLYLDRVPAHAVVDEAVGEARRRVHRAGAGFVNAVLRRVARAPELASWPVTARDPLRRLAIETSHPDRLVRRWLDRFGEAATRRLLAANNRAKPLQLLAFRDRGGPLALAAALAADGVETTPAELSPLGLTVVAGDPLAAGAFARGELYLQDDASQAAALVPPPAAGETVLDAGRRPGRQELRDDRLGARAPAAPGGRGGGAVAASRGQPAAPGPAPAAGRGRRPAAAGRRPASTGSWSICPARGSGTLRRHPELKWRIDRRRAATGSPARASRCSPAPPPRCGPAACWWRSPARSSARRTRRSWPRFLAGRGDFAPQPVAERLPPSDARRRRRGGPVAGAAGRRPRRLHRPGPAAAGLTN